MKIIGLPTFTLRDLAAANPASLARTPGCHVSQVVDQIMRAVDPAKAKQTYAEDDSENWQETGFLWEELLSAVFAARALTRPEDTGTRFRPGELVKDGVIGSPDALVLYSDPWNPGIVLEEYKATWKSSRGFDLYDKKWLRYLLQIQAYCTLAGTTHARLYILHINGNYDRYVPEIAVWAIEFTETELAEAWDSLTNTARHQGWII